MGPSRQRLAIEVSLAAALGLLLGMLPELDAVTRLMAKAPQFVTRAIYSPEVVTRPGALLRSGAVGNMLVFGGIWYMLRSGARGSRRRRITAGVLIVWSIVALFLAVVGNR